MFDEYLHSLESYGAKDKEFGKQLIRHLEFGLEEQLPLYAVHGFCTDGGVAGAMIKSVIPQAHIVPLDYVTLKNKGIRPILQDLSWSGIVDLEPFNKTVVDWYVDHHISVIGLPINANQIRFDANGDSGSFQLFKSGFIPELSKDIIDLAIMTRITDTANYQTEAPVQQLKSISDIEITVTDGKEGRIQYEQRVWLLDDAWSTVNDLHDQLNLHKYLATDGLFGVSKVLDRINSKRSFRKVNYDTAEAVDIVSDIVIFVYPDEKYDRFAIDRRLQRRGVAVTASLAQTQLGVKISLRRSKLREKELSNIKLNELAAQLNGGGHPGASGGFSSDEVDAIAIISNWGKKLGLTHQIEYLN